MKKLFILAFLILFSPSAFAQDFYHEMTLLSEEGGWTTYEYYFSGSTVPPEYSPLVSGIPGVIGFAAVSFPGHTPTIMAIGATSLGAPSPCATPLTSRSYHYGKDFSQTIIRHMCTTTIPGHIEGFFTDLNGNMIDGTSFKVKLVG